MTTATPKAGSNGELRQRAAKAGAAAEKAADKVASKAAAAVESAPAIGLLDILRALAGVALISTVASYAVSHGESFTWGLAARKPWWMDYKQIQLAIKGPLLLTNDDLAAYDGSDPTKPILLALNRTIYDVSASAAVYGPGGMYSSLAAKDASRSYITTCFDPIEDLVPYFGGVEEVYVPLWLSRKPPKDELDKIGTGEIFKGKDAEDLIDDIRKKVGRKNIKPLQEKAYAKAKERVKEQVKTWEAMFEKKAYPVVGKVIGVDEEDPNKWRHLGFCEEAKNQRPPMGESLMEAMESVGKDTKLNLNMGRMMGNMGGGGDKKKKKKKKAKSKEGDRDQDFKEQMGLRGEDQPDESPELDDKANVRIEDMLKGGKYYGGDKKMPKEVEEVLKTGPENADPDAVKKALEMLKQRKKEQDAEAAGKAGEKAAEL